jgi:hypothetical protein
MQVVVRVLVYQPGESGKVQEIPDTLGALQEVVGGFIEVIFDDQAGVHLFVNDFAEKLPVNRVFGQHQVRGNAVFSRNDEQGRTAGLYDDDIERIRALYG